MRFISQIIVILCINFVGFSGSKMGINYMNGSNRRPPIISRLPSNERPTHSQHDDLIKYIYDSWMKVEMDRASNSVMYYKDETVHNLKDFQPFDLEAYWGRRMHLNIENHQS